jgi:protocatechuate 4,5-dioxygenase, beta chain
MARLIGGIGISHSPSMGGEYDKGMRQGFDPDWQGWYDGTRPVKDWLTEAAPDRLVIVYNDHLNHFQFDAYPTFAIGVADEFPQADEGWGQRALPALPGDTDFGWHVTERLVREDGFDLTVCQELALDHGIYSWLPYLADPPWAMKVLPIAVNMVRQPLPTSQRLWQLGAALGRAIRAWPGEERVLIVATGGMSHQISGARFGMANEDLDHFFLARLKDEAAALLAISQEEMMRVGGTDAVELSMWFAMRAALSAEVEEVYRHHSFPKITGCGVIVFAEPEAQAAHVPVPAGEGA